MTQTDDLIAQLASDDAQVASRSGMAWRFAGLLALALGAAVLAIALVLDGAFPNVATVGIGPLFVKWAFSLSLVMLAPMALWVLGQPGLRAKWLSRALAVPFVLVLALFVLDAALAPQSFPGATWRSCLSAMTLISPLAFAIAILAMRALAPTETRRAGAVAGLFGGGVAMTAYTPYCPEMGMLYMVVFYVLPILSMAVVGWLAGPRLLRW